MCWLMYVDCCALFAVLFVVCGWQLRVVHCSSCGVCCLLCVICFVLFVVCNVLMVVVRCLPLVACLSFDVLTVVR